MNLRSHESIMRIVTALTLFSSAAASARAQTGPRDLTRATLEDLLNITITTASRTEEGLGGAPARVQVVTAAQIERRGYRSLADLLRDVPDFKVEIGTEPDYPTDVTVQGSRDADRVVLLLDGIRISSPTNEPLPILANYPVHNARQVEILYGPASALYGADAFSAVINIISRDASEAPGVSLATSGGQYGLYQQTGSYGTRIGANGDLVLAGQFLYDRQPNLSRFYPDDFHGLQGQRTGVFPTIFGPMTPGQPISPDYDIPLSAHSFQATFRNGGLQLSLFENRSRVSTTAAYSPDNAAYTPSAFNDNKLFVAGAAYERKVGRVTATSTITISRHELDPQSGYMNVYSNFERSYKYAFGSMAKAEEQLSWKLARSVTVTTGGTFERFFAIPQGADLNAPIQSRDLPGTILDTNIVDNFIKLRYSNAGAYAQVQYTLGPRFAITLGERADRNTRYGASFNPRVGFVSRPASGTTVKLMFGTAYLAPSPYVAYGHYGSFYSTDGGKTYASSFWHLANPDLKPQHKKTVEMDIHQMLTPDLSLSGSAFYSRFTNLIQRSDLPSAKPGFFLGWPVDFIETASNGGRQTTYGGTVGLDLVKSFQSTGRVEAHAALTFTDGYSRMTEDDAPLQIGAMAPVQFRAGADVDAAAWSFAPRMTIVGAQRTLATATVAGSLVRRTLPGYSTVDANIRRREVFKHLDAFVTIENVFDQRYRNINVRAFTNPEELIGAPQNPRRITLGFNLRVR